MFRTEIFLTEITRTVLTLRAEAAVPIHKKEPPRNPPPPPSHDEERKTWIHSVFEGMLTNETKVLYKGRKEGRMEGEHEGREEGRDGRDGRKEGGGKEGHKEGRT